MAVLLLRLSAPLQSWGVSSKFDTRDTGREPTKSGVIGMIAAAMGYRRFETDKIAKLNRLKFAVLVEKEGDFLKDYQTVCTEDGWQKKKNHKSLGSSDTYTTERFYLADASFTVGLEDEKEELIKIENALKTPYFPLYLGRRSCPPCGKIVLGIEDDNLEKVFSDSEIMGKYISESGTKRIVTESENDGYLTKDLPLNFDKSHREYGYRKVKNNAVNIPKKIEKSDAETDHDSFSQIGEDFIETEQRFDKSSFETSHDIISQVGGED
jgi:CRISPR system Cascade subunit CasD